VQWLCLACWALVQDCFFRSFFLREDVTEAAGSGPEVAFLEQGAAQAGEASAEVAAISAGAAVVALEAEEHQETGNGA